MADKATGAGPVIPEGLVDRIRLAISDPAVFVQRADKYLESVSHWSARAVRHVLGDWLRFHVLVPKDEHARLTQVEATSPEPDGFMIATRSNLGKPGVPLAFRASREDAVETLADRRRTYPSAVLYALHQVGGGGRG